ncbi:MAG: hypothetical protein CMI17_10705 [Opitutaceae bacterium]|nr:hypothetical protein [Opitutaceae bacterium]
MKSLIGIWITLMTLGLVAEEAKPAFFPGGETEIDVSADNRAEQAIRKWTDPEVWEEKDPAEAPYYWIFKVVGRHVFRVLAGITAGSVAVGTVVANEVLFGRMDVTRDGECKVFRKAVAGDRLLYTEYPNINYAQTPRGKWMLYNLESDPSQDREVGADHPEIVQQMASAYEQWWNKVRPLLINEVGYYE